MKDEPQVSLTLRLGSYGQKVLTVSVPISERLAKEMTEPMELSDEPLSLLLASRGMFGGKGDAVTTRQRTFRMRREISEEIAQALVSKLEEMLGTDDKVNGYRREEWSENDRRQADFVRGRK